MNILKFAFVLLTATGLGFGIDEVMGTDNNEQGYVDVESNDFEYNFGYCHGSDEYFLEHILERLSEEEQVLVQIKIDELLLKYDINEEQLNDDYEVRYQFMTELMEFLDEGGYEYHYYENEEDGYGRHGRMHR